MKGFLACCLIALTGRVLAGAVEEPIPETAIRVSASSMYGQEQTCRNLVNGAGMTNGRHDNHAGAFTMWQTPESPAASSPGVGLPVSPAWVRFEFPQTMALTEVRIWNHNQTNYTDRGFCKAELFASEDGTTWRSKEIEIPRATGAANMPCSLTVKWPVNCRFVVIAAKTNYGSTCYGLSAVQFIRR
jgi:hypothetical protein